MKLPGLIVTAILAVLFYASALYAGLPPVDVELSVTVDSISAGDSVAIDMAVENYSTTEVATTAVVTLSLPPGTTNVVSSDCTLLQPLIMQCVMPELAPDEIITITAAATLNVEGNNLLSASVTLTELQSSGTPYDFRQDSKIVAVEVLPADASAIDLQVAFTGEFYETWHGTWDHLYLTVRNNHDTNTALFPFVELVLEDSYEFRSGDHCAASGQLVICDFQRLPPGAETTAEIILVAKTLDEAASVTASVSSTQPDAEPQNNNAQYTGTIVPASILCGGGCQPIVTTDSSTVAGNSDSAQLELESSNIETAISEPTLTTIDSSPNSGGGTVPVQTFTLLFGLLVTVRLTKRCDHNI